jgi:sugar/nucleoside kinase (ribokinase family)
MSSPLLIVGSMAFDDLDLPTTKARDVVGGAATYAALAASHFSTVRIVAVVGSDFPQPTLDDLARRGVDVLGVERAAGKTFRWWGRYADDLGSRTTLDTQLNVFAELDVLNQVKKPRLVAADTMNFWIEGERKLLGQVLERIDLLVVNDEELRQLAQVRNLKLAARAVMGMGPKRLIVKRGEFGALLFDEEGSFFVPAYPLEAEIDPTGAGDTFAGALLGYLAQKGSLDRATFRRALHAASTVASFCVEDVGTKRLASLQHAHIVARQAELRALVHPGE